MSYINSNIATPVLMGVVYSLQMSGLGEDKPNEHRLVKLLHQTPTQTHRLSVP